MGVMKLFNAIRQRAIQIAVSENRKANKSGRFNTFLQEKAVQYIGSLITRKSRLHVPG